jgi:hypothetical protein
MCCTRLSGLEEMSDGITGETAILVKERWPAIERLAKALLKPRVLRGAEVEDRIKDE